MWKTTQMSISKGVDEQNVVCPYTGMLFSLERDETVTRATKYMNLKNVALSESSQTQKPHVVGRSPRT